MNPGLTFLDVEHVARIHSRLIEEFGGEEGLRDAGLLESAVAMPKARFGGQFLHDSVDDMAAAYLFHLVCNHPFVDGNKRTGLTTAILFLKLNHQRLEATDRELEELTVAIASGRLSKAGACDFFRAHTRAE